MRFWVFLDFVVFLDSWLPGYLSILGAMFAFYPWLSFGRKTATTTKQTNKPSGILKLICLEAFHINKKIIYTIRMTIRCNLKFKLHGSLEAIRWLERQHIGSEHTLCLQMTGVYFLAPTWCNFSSRKRDPLFWIPYALHSRKTHIHM